MQAKLDMSSPKGVGSRGWSWKMGDWTCRHSIAIKAQGSVLEFEQKHKKVT